VSDDSYTLKEVAELLGVSKRTLQRRIREGAFPHKFLAPGRHGLETRIPAGDVRLLLEAGRAQDSIAANRTLVPQSTALALTGGLTAGDLETVRETVIALARQERESVLQLVQQSLDAQEQEAAALRSQIASVQSAVDRLRRRLEAWIEAPSAPYPSDPPSTRSDDYGSSLLGEIEALLSRLPRG